MAQVYGLFNTITGRVYVGCTKNKLAKRMREHRCLLNQGRHSEIDLQQEWVSHGAEAFRIVAIESLQGGASADEKREAEMRWMNHYADAGLLYNRNRFSFQPPPDAIPKGVEASRTVVGKRWTAEANERRSLAQLGKPKGHGAKISATKRAKRAATLKSDDIV